MSKQLQQEFLDECITILREVDEYEFNLSTEWEPEDGCGCIIGHYKIRQGYYSYNDFDGGNVVSKGYLFQDRNYDNIIYFLRDGLKFNRKQVTELRKIFGFGKNIYDKSHALISQYEVLDKLIQFMRNNEFVVPEFDTVKVMIRS